MKLQSVLATGVLAMLLAAASGVQAAADASSAVKADATKEAVGEKAAAKKKVKPHSHVEEKTGMAATAGEAKVAEAANDKSRHLHQRDAK